MLKVDSNFSDPAQVLIPVIRGNSLYSIIDGTTWSQAQTKSVDLGGSLVTIETQEEDAFLINNLYGVPSHQPGGGDTTSPRNVYFIGLYNSAYGRQTTWASGSQAGFRYYDISYNNNTQFNPGVFVVSSNHIPGQGHWVSVDNNSTFYKSWGWKHYGIAEIPLQLSISLPAEPTEGAGPFTTSINLSAGTQESGNLAENTQIYWNISGITADDLDTGALAGSGAINNGKLDIQHSLKVDTDTGEQFSVSVYSDAEMTQQIGTTSSFGIIESNKTSNRPVSLAERVIHYAAYEGAPLIEIAPKVDSPHSGRNEYGFEYASIYGSEVTLTGEGGWSRKKLTQMVDLDDSISGGIVRLNFKPIAANGQEGARIRFNYRLLLNDSSTEDVLSSGTIDAIVGTGLEPLLWQHGGISTNQGEIAIERDFSASAGTTLALELQFYNVTANGNEYFTFDTGFSIVNGLAEWHASSIEEVPSTLMASIRGNSLYTIVDGPSWTQAEANSVALGGHLATVNNAAENAFIVSEFSGKTGENQGLWIGFNDAKSEGDFKWTSGEVSSYANFFVYEPNGGSGENYVHLWSSNPWGYPVGSWNDISDLPDAGNPDPSGKIKYFNGIAEIPLQLSISLPTAPTEGAGPFTTSINLSAGTTTNLAEGATVYWKVSGITADDLNVGSLMGSGEIKDGKLDIQHGLKADIVNEDELFEKLCVNIIKARPGGGFREDGAASSESLQRK